MKPRFFSSRWFAIAAFLAMPTPATDRAATATVLGWNNLGMHCMDSDYSIFTILPPYNTIEAQLIIGGVLVTNTAGYALTYQAMAGPWPCPFQIPRATGSIGCGNDNPYRNKFIRWQAEGSPLAL